MIGWVERTGVMELFRMIENVILLYVELRMVNCEKRSYLLEIMSMF